MIACPVCKAEYDPRVAECPTCGPIPRKPGLSRNTFVPDYSQPGVKERVDAEVDFIVDLDDDWRRSK